jgi:DNA-binding NarL/FixJ family response regulator
LAIDDEAIVRDRVKPVLERHGARHIVIGHTMPAGAHGIQARAGGAVMAIDVGMSRHYRGGSAACLLIEAGKFYSVSAEGTKGLAPEP